MKSRVIQVVALTAALAVVSTSFSSCAYILHPERRGNKSGPTDTGCLVMDILWLIPGIIPGVIALAVDFSNGAIYMGGGRRRSAATHHVDHKTKIVVVKPKVAHRSVLEVKMVSHRGKVLYHHKTTLRPGDRKPGDLTIPLRRILSKTNIQKGNKVKIRFQVLMDGNTWTDTSLIVL